MNQIDPREVLALVPHQLSFAPDNSLVVVPVTDAPDGRACTSNVDRIDLHPDALPSAYADWARSRMEGADGAVIVVYARTLERAERVLGPLLTTIDGVRAALAVIGQCWVDLLDPTRSVQALPGSADTLIGAQMTLRNTSYYASRDEAFGYAPPAHD